MSEHGATVSGDGRTDPTGERTDSTGRTASTTPRSRRSLLAGLAAGAGALVAQAAAPLSAGAANGSTVKVGQTNTGTDPTAFRNTRHVANARALVGTTTWTGTAAQSAGVTGESKGRDGIGVFGKANSGPGARAVLGISTSGTGVQGQGVALGVYGSATDAAGAGVKGSGKDGVYGDGERYGVFGVGRYGVEGHSNQEWGVRGVGLGVGSIGVAGTGVAQGISGSGGTDGVFGTSGVYAIRGVRTGSGYAGYFQGPVHVAGTLTKTGGSFMIDHPIEPERRYLIHSFVEAPERLNIFRGTVKLNSKGRATVRLPRYFDAANREPSYQLTAVGAAAPELHVAKVVSGDRFVIAGGSPGLTVCWQVTTARDDAWARRNPLRVEQLKKRADQGRYLDPVTLGKPRSMGIHPDMSRRLRHVSQRPRRIRPAS
jgi:hypothetical protein